jgi:hypothetical protein
MFMPTVTGQMAFDYAHERMCAAVPAAACCVRTVGAVRAAGLGAFYDRMILRNDPQGARHPACYHVSVHPPEVGADVELLKRVATADGFAVCNVRAAAEPIDLPDSQDLTGDTATLLLECVLQREDLPLSVRFEAAVAQYVLADCTEANVFSAIARDERLAWMLSLHNFGKEKRDVVTDDVIRSIEIEIRRAFRATVQVTNCLSKSSFAPIASLWPNSASARRSILSRSPSPAWARTCTCLATTHACTPLINMRLCRLLVMPRRQPTPTLSPDAKVLKNRDEMARNEANVDHVAHGIADMKMATGCTIMLHGEGKPPKECVASVLTATP